MAHFFPQDVTQDIDWDHLYETLKWPISHWVRNSGLWVGQENDKVDDIRSEAIVHTMKRLQDAERRGEVVRSVEALCRKIAYNHFLDLIRKEERVIRLSELPAAMSATHISMEDVVLEAVYVEQLFNIVAQALQGFPRKSKTALLFDLVKRMEITQQPTPLQSALLQAGINFEDYRRQGPPCEAEQRRQAALLSYAYRKLAHHDSVRRYIS